MVKLNRHREIYLDVQQVSLQQDIERVRVRIKCVTKLDSQNPTYNPHKPYAWGDYEGWEGKILRESTNGDVPAWLVKISSDGINFVKMHINKTDLEIIT